MAVYKGYLKGGAYTFTSAMAPLWHEFWALHSEVIGRGWGFTIQKVKAHTSKQDVKDGIITEQRRAGNTNVDKAAKWGAELAGNILTHIFEYLKIKEGDYVNFPQQCN